MTTLHQDPVRHSFLLRQSQLAAELNHSSNIVTFVPMSEGACDRYLIELACKGLTRHPDGQVEVRQRWVFGLQFPAEYLAKAVHVASLLNFLGPTQLWHSNVNGPFVCIRVKPGMSIVEIAHALTDLVTWRLFSLADPLNEEAAQWARNVEPGTLPLDRRPLRWKTGDAESQASEILVNEVT